MKKTIPFLLAVALTACGQSETPQQVNPLTVEELASNPERLNRPLKNPSPPPVWAATI